MQHTVDIINYLKAKGINFIMRAKGKFKDGGRLNLQNEQQEEKAR